MIRRFLPDIVVRVAPDWLVELAETYASFVITGVSGAALNLLVTWSLTEYVFGVQNYFYGYLCGLAVNLTYNFIRHSFVTFNTSGDHATRFAAFITYSLAMAALQAFAVDAVVGWVGEEYYLVVIALVIAVFSTVTFLLCEYWLFTEWS